MLAFYVYFRQKVIRQGAAMKSWAGAFSNDSDICQSDLSRMPFLTLSNVQVWAVDLENPQTNIFNEIWLNMGNLPYNNIVGCFLSVEIELVGNKNRIIYKSKAYLSCIMKCTTLVEAIMTALSISNFRGCHVKMTLHIITPIPNRASLLSILTKM